MDIVAGKNIIEAALNSNAKIKKLIIDKNAKDPHYANLAKSAKERGICVDYADKARLTELYGADNHQGAAAYISPFEYASVSELLNIASKKNEHPFIIILDHLEDPHNFGAVLRTAEAAGVHGIVIPNRRAASVNSTVYRTSAGAAFFMPVALVSNISMAIDSLKKSGVWVYGFDAAGKNMYDEKMSGPAAIVIGGEGSGISALAAKKCDAIVSIPMFGRLTSLNASVSAGIAIYEIIRQRTQNEK